MGQKATTVYILVLIIVLGIMAFVHYELSMERDLRLKLFCESAYASEKVDVYGPNCFDFMKTAFQ